MKASTPETPLPPVPFRHQHLLRIADLSRRDIETILDTARALKEISFREIKKVPTLRGKTIINCFFETSTRTSSSFDIAAKRLSADTVNFSPSASALTKGESIVDTVRTLHAMQPDALIIRHRGSGVPQRVAALLPQCHIINAGDGMHEHPTQALLDALTIQEAKGRIRGLTVAILGDVEHSRVARSDIILLRKMGAKVIAAGPRTLLPPPLAQWGVTVAASVEAAIRAADVVMCLRIQQERLHGFALPSLREYARHYGVSARRLAGAKPDVVIMHPGPVNRGVEIAPDVADGARSLILDQVENGIAVRMAVLYLLCATKNS
ncbi:MAG: aspartate carbamoyltransferase catalytic subunit [Deltaproteobacteria bacterium]|nr:aspartate carbamoyltransferase catalytic subunit [Deltaproteobacteria bacterium]